MVLALVNVPFRETVVPRGFNVSANRLPDAEPRTLTASNPMLPLPRIESPSCMRVKSTTVGVPTMLTLPNHCPVDQGQTSRRGCTPPAWQGNKLA